jgi:UDP-glucose 4-epimerase
MLLAVSRTAKRVNIFNLGVDSYCKLHESVTWICAALGLNPQITYTGGDRGWVGDNPFIFLDTSRIRALGWRPKLSIEEGVVKTVAFLRNNPWVLNAREDLPGLRS